ncbi:MAG: hypothetical protein GWP08_19985 [Nitrospiraceae bacterium]|nr:hypothetical protein [Nitrospiraceae bacterium]
MQQPYEQWRDGAHASLACTKCHQGTIGTDVHNVWATLRGAQTVARKPQIDRQACLQCHSTNARWAHIASVVDRHGGGDTPWSDLSIVAHAHLEKDDCMKCHVRPAHGSVTLHAVHTDDSPHLDGELDDPAWKQSVPLKVHLMGGNLIGRTTLDIRAVYTDTLLSVAFRWADPTESAEKAMWINDNHGWQTTGAKRAGEAGNEDRVMTVWDVSIPRFQQEGCLVACHPGVSAAKYLEEPGLGDIWHWKAARGNPVGYCDDKYIDNIRSGPDGGRHGDSVELHKGTTGNSNPYGTGPAFMQNPGIKPRDPRFLLSSEAVPIPKGKVFSTGQRIPGYVLSIPDGSRGDVRCGGKWDEGIWTVELSRKLVTGEIDDVQFSDLLKSYPFAVAVVDNASGAEHSFSSVLRLQFDK